jgi:hypothetical protein
MAVDKIYMQYPEEVEKIDNWHNVEIPMRGDVVKHNDKEYRVKFRIFDSKAHIVTVILEEVSDNN